ncbi:MAG: tetratricopeptide repeat protein, partial [Firmicutes bacterium]|nr:tetratricopeptide repeat protein [Bacillota bacterium]
MQRFTSTRFFGVLLFLLSVTVITLIVTADEEVPSPSPADRYQQALNLYYQGEFYQSLDLMATLVRDNPADKEIRFDLTYLLREAGRFPEAISHLSHLVKTHPNQTAYWHALLATTYLAGDYYRVLALKTPEASAETSFWKGLAAYELGVYALAKDHLQQVVTLAPFHPLAYYYLGLINLAEKDFAQAKTNLTQALTQDPNLFIALYELARAYLGLGDYKAAYNRLKQTERVAPGNPQIQAELQNLIAAHPQLLVEEEKEAAAHRKTAAVPRAVPLAGETTGMTTVRVGLAEQVHSLWAKTGGPFRLATVSASKTLTGDPQTILRFSFSPQGRIQIYNDQDKLLLETTEPVNLSYADP